MKSGDIIETYEGVFIIVYVGDGYLICIPFEVGKTFTGIVM